MEQPELEVPRAAFDAAGATTTLIAPGETVQAFTDDVDRADTFAVDLALANADAADFDALVIPGGTTNADALRLKADAVSLVQAFVAAGKPVASICHGPWLLVEADVLSGKTLTSYASVATDVRNAGGTWVDDEAFTCPADGWTLVTSRDPGDLDAFVEAAGAAFGS